ncbi:pyrroline-5-carboxylate reductase [Pseudomonas sp. GM21]|jgi:pyrroline-5-carboxylate reductase|uniref:pyrroline-5-carboxylate reductase family protein n=1 Tax=Pseudomonas sp. GM21 TaxID=1144325 RepID=UPI0002727560|nr:pyrroline-5-carboxylate reductase dimerization domain-containing protein [Pseudomonas sp. GM21]EJM16358.1 pyrroline-5-carboxylate reductase [Pseudomonas sp. GM21]
MCEEPTIGIIGGSGWLGRSIALAMLDKAFVQPGALVLSNRSASNPLPVAKWSQVTITRDNQELVERCEVVIVSVRPEQFAEVEIFAENRLVISLMAGVSLQDVAQRTGSRQVIRAMANAAAEIGQSYTPWLATQEVSEEQKAFAQRLFETFGGADEVFSESHLNYLTALVGTGPAYPALLARSLFQHAMSSGLPPAIAQRASHAVVVQASQLIGNGHSVDELLEALISYRGVTAAGLDAMLASGFDKTIKAGLDSAASVANSMSPFTHSADTKEGPMTR